ncbi:DUF397 domain-containing protein [Streptomyces sp. 110]|uniref:DUF397 domain-containing protein n=1 Tax=Streptomyces endocoffeicus TaxID=2898945 RepID=A0ABS1Q755_9ACTN|nr:DUF397 domain-containing protein [Streptomyces endocoffeicus]MBL1120498.1 DUF397 domain-containing protein [Streptomyces endocoffeicus]
MTTKPKWRTSSYTKSDTCVEVSDNQPDLVLVRDSKDPDRGCLALRPAAWSSFLDFLRATEVRPGRVR